MATLQSFNQKPVLHILATLERTNDDVCRVLAGRIRRCNADKNNYIGKGMFVNDFGRKKDGIGTITACGSRFCPNCVSKSAQKNYRTAKYVLDNLYRPKYLTLTLADSALVGLSMNRQFEVFAYTYREMYRRSNFFQTKKSKLNNKPKKIDGTIKNIEFTEDENGVARHVHYTLICDSPFLSKDDFLADFNKAFNVACNHFGLKYKEITNFYIKEIVEKVTDESTQISKADAIRKVARYLTKPQNWHSLKPAELIEMVENEKKYRMFAVTGTCAELARQGREVSKAARERRYQKTVTIYQRTLIVPTSSPTPASTPTISVPATLIPSTPTPKQPTRIRKKSWRERIKNKLISVEDYLKELDASFLMMCEFRMKQLPEKYYWATDFRTLDGISFETRLRYIEQDKKNKKRADSHQKRAVYDADKNARILFDELKTQKPTFVFIPIPSNNTVQTQVYNF